MELGGQFVIRAPREKVWDLLMDADVLRGCIPGCQSLEGSVEDGFTAKVALGIGPVKATFSGSVKLTDLDAPSAFRITGSGNGGAAGFASGGAKVSLSDVPEGTQLNYEADAKIGGRLAQLGSRLIQSTSAKLSGQFFSTFAALASERVSV